MLTIYNSLTRKRETFTPLHTPNVGVYTCGPTVYNHPTIGNWRTYTLSDIVIRTLKVAGYHVSFIMNITDVGHLTGDNKGDADTGEDRMEKAAKKENKSAWDIAEFYTKAFIKAYDELHLTRPKRFTKATDHIKEQIDLIKKIEEKGFTYRTSDGIYFDTIAYEKEGNVYGVLSSLDKIKEGARIAPNPEKKDPRDFALWKFSPKDKKRHMEWNSPWGIGFPGWHIECSAMSMKYLGEQFDIHIGGEDLRATHHPNEIVQSEAATGKKPFVKYWIHGAFLLVNGGRMGKSLGNAYTMIDIQKRGYSPLDLRYFYLTAHYRTKQNFTWQALSSSRKARINLKKAVNQLRIQAQKEKTRTILSSDKLDKTNKFRKKFIDAVSDDFNIPEALSVTWQTLKSNIPSEDKFDLIMFFDEILGLDLSRPYTFKESIPREINQLAQKRWKYKQNKKYNKADELRETIEKKGYEIEDKKDSYKIKKKDNLL